MSVKSISSGNSIPSSPTSELLEMPPTPESTVTTPYYFCNPIRTPKDHPLSTASILKKKHASTNRIEQIIQNWRERISSGVSKHQIKKATVELKRLHRLAFKKAQSRGEKETRHLELTREWTNLELADFADTMKPFLKN